MSDDKKKIVVIGTDTDVGKTFFCGALCKAIMQRKNTNSFGSVSMSELAEKSSKKLLCYIKPFQSGVGYKTLRSEKKLFDLELVGEDRRKRFRRNFVREVENKNEGKWVERGRERREGDYNYVCEKSFLPFDDAFSFGNYMRPAAPFLAASEVGETVEYGSILNKTKRCFERYKVSVVEGIGGLLVPLYYGAKDSASKFVGEMSNDTSSVVDTMLWKNTEKQCVTFASFIASLGRNSKVIVVARLGLGTINHTLLTLSSLRSFGVKPVSVQLNHYFKNVDDKINIGNLSFLQKMLTGDGIDVQVFRNEVSEDSLKKILT